MPVQSAVPSPDVRAECRQIGDSSFAEAMPRQGPNCDFRLIQPTTVNRRVVSREAIPDLAADLCAEQICQRFWAMNIEVVQHQMNRSGRWVLKGQVKDHFRKFDRRAVSCWIGEVPSGFQFHCAEDIGVTASRASLPEPAESLHSAVCASHFGPSLEP